MENKNCKNNPNNNGDVWEFRFLQKKGLTHEHRSMLNQDRFSYRTKEDKLCAVLVDGIGKTDLNVLGCESVADYIVDFLLAEDNIGVVKKRVTIERLLMGIDEQMEQLSKTHGVDKKEFSSTFMVIYIDKSKQSYCSYHLGDGIILYKDSDEKLRIMSYPKNGNCNNKTYLTSSSKAYQYVKCFQGDLNDITEIILMTDGIYEHPIQMENLEKIISKIHKNEDLCISEDDKSVVALRRRSCEKRARRRNENRVFRNRISVHKPE